MVWALESGWGAALAGNMADWAAAWPPAVYPLCLFFVMGGALLLVFPLTLAGDHVHRVQYEEAEEAPLGYWLQGYFTELLVGVLLGLVVLAAMVWLPGTWWLLAAAIWVGIDYVIHAYPGMLLVAQDDEEDQQRKADPDILNALRSPLEDAGFAVTDVRVFDAEEDGLDFVSDVMVARHGGKRIVYLSAACAHGWDYPAIIASALHRVWLSGRALRMKKNTFAALSGLVAFGGYAAIFPLVKERYGFGVVSDPGAIPLLLLWLVLIMVIHAVVAGWLQRQWIARGDDWVAHRMGSPDGMVAALERMRDNDEPPQAIPRWAEWLLPVGPDINRRLDRMTQGKQAE